MAVRGLVKNFSQSSSFKPAMELLENLDQDGVECYAQVVPGKLYWAAVDMAKFTSLIRTRPNTTLIKPIFKESIPIRNVLKHRLDTLEAEDSDENQDIKQNAPKSRRGGSTFKIHVNHSKTNKVVYTDKVFTYRPLAHDFGPLDLPTTFRYIDFLDDCFDSDSVIIHISDYRFPKLCANSAYLVSVYALLRFKMTSSRIWDCFSKISEIYLPPFRDAGSALCCSFPLTIKNCCDGIELSLIHKWIDWDNFDVNKAEHFQSIENVVYVCPRYVLQLQ